MGQKTHQDGSFLMSDCPHCKIPMLVGSNVYPTGDGEYDVEYYQYCDKCGADYS
jgi:hypothetical protein